MKYPDDSLFGAPMTRLHDTDTAMSGARDVLLRKNTQALQLLAQYAKTALTDEEAGLRSKLALKPKCCYWKRCSELRTNGLIADTGIRRLSSANSFMMVCEITPAGQHIYQALYNATD